MLEVHFGQMAMIAFVNISIVAKDSTEDGCYGVQVGVLSIGLLHLKTKLPERAETRLT